LGAAARRCRAGTWLASIKPQRDFCFYVLGFTEGEGSFPVSIRHRTDRKYGFTISPTFSVSQKEEKILRTLQHFFGCGKVRRQGNGWVYEVSSLPMLRQRIIPFFQKYSFRTSHRLTVFSGFSRICDLLHETPDYVYNDGLREFWALLEKTTVSVKRSRKYALHDLETWRKDAAAPPN